MLAALPVRQPAGGLGLVDPDAQDVQRLDGLYGPRQSRDAADFALVADGIARGDLLRLQLRQRLFGLPAQVHHHRPRPAVRALRRVVRVSRHDLISRHAHIIGDQRMRARSAREKSNAP